jgi:hypothetical protein
VGAKVHEQMEKVMVEYYKCGAVKLELETLMWQLGGERKKAKELFKIHMVKLQDLVPLLSCTLVPANLVRRGT